MLSKRPTAASPLSPVRPWMGMGRMDRPDIRPVMLPRRNGPTLDVIGNAGRPGNWWGVVTDNGQANGTPIVQGGGDPAPGAYVSMTALNLLGADGQGLPDRSPFKYVDSATVPHISLPEVVIHRARGVVVGCRCVVTNTENGAAVETVVADSGNNDHIGEISVACAKAVGLRVGNSNEANGGGTQPRGDSLPVFSQYGGDGEWDHVSAPAQLTRSGLDSER